MSADSALRVPEVTKSSRKLSPMAMPSGTSSESAGSSLSTSATVVVLCVPGDTPDGNSPKLSVRASSRTYSSWSPSSVATTTKLSVGRPSTRVLDESKVTETGTPE